jgi:hypothetical protein
MCAAKAQSGMVAASDGMGISNGKEYSGFWVSNREFAKSAILDARRDSG